MMTIAPVVKTVTVPLTPTEAFAAFTDQLAEWWPLATHSVGGADAIDVIMEPRVGGQIIESIKDGSTSVWGTLAAYDPPGKVAFTWHPGSSAEEATHVEVTFTAAAGDQDATEVVLTHTGWEIRTDGAAARDRYDPGWDFVLGKYLEKVG